MIINYQTQSLCYDLINTTYVLVIFNTAFLIAVRSSYFWIYAYSRENDLQRISILRFLEHNISQTSFLLKCVRIESYFSSLMETNKAIICQRLIRIKMRVQAIWWYAIRSNRLIYLISKSLTASSISLRLIVFRRNISNLLLTETCYKIIYILIEKKKFAIFYPCSRSFIFYRTLNVLSADPSDLLPTDLHIWVRSI